MKQQWKVFFNSHKTALLLYNKYMNNYFFALIFIFLSICLFTSSCSSESEVKPIVTYDESENTMTSSRAAKLAKRHIAIRNYNWSDVSKVTEEESSFRVEFETPQAELRLLGQRALMVSKDNGLVTAIKRR